MQQSLSTTVYEALALLVSGDAELWEIIGISFSVSGTAIVIAMLPAMAIGFVLAFYDFVGRRLLIAIFNTLLSVPAVVIGLTFYLVLSRQGPLGDLRLLFTQTAMIIGQIALCFPLLVAMSHTAFQSIERRAWENAISMGHSSLGALLLIIREARFALLAAVLAAFGRIIAEVGASMMLGGNVLHQTRNIPTAIALETSKGEFAQGIALGIVLLVLAFVLNGLLHLFQGRGELS